MKIILSFSLIFNIVLGVLLLKQERKPMYEKLIIETHARSDELTSLTAAPKRELREKKAPVSGETEILPGPIALPMGDAEMADTHEKMEEERADFLTQELELSNETVFEYQRLRNEFFEKSSQLWRDGAFGEPSFEGRRKMLDMEEKLHKDLISLLGEEKWARYQKFRENYNKQGFQNQIEENQTFLFMGL